LNRNFSFSRIIQLFDQFKGSVMGGSGAQSLSGRAARSGVWIGGGFVVQRGLQFASNLILTRLLFPEAFGLMALATVFLVGLNMFSDIGIKPSIIRDPRGNQPTFLNTAWTIQVIRGFGLFVAGCLLAYPISLIYDQPILFALLAVLSSTAAIAGFNSVKVITAERDLDFKSVIFVQVTGQVISIILMVALAYEFRSVWSLAAANVFGSMTTLFLGHLILRGHRHRFALEPEATKSIVHFGKWIFFSTIATYLGGEGLRAVQGGLITPAEFGVLAIAYTIAAIPNELTLKLASSIGLPALSEAFRKDPASMAGVLHKFRKRVLMLALILVSAVVLTSEFLITLLYDERYHAAGAFVVAITLSNAISLIANGYNDAMLSLGKSRIFMIFMAIAAATRIFGTIAGFEIFGIVGMIFGIGVANLTNLLFVWPVMRRFGLMDLKLDLLYVTFVLILFVIINLYPI
jgi:O-antigen/teichoic acid export membrane protein